MGELDASLPVIQWAVDEAARRGLETIEANAQAEQAEPIVAACLACGDLDPAALADARSALTRTRQLGETNAT